MRTHLFVRRAAVGHKKAAGNTSMVPSIIDEHGLSSHFRKTQNGGVIEIGPTTAMRNGFQIGEQIGHRIKADLLFALLGLLYLLGNYIFVGIGFSFSWSVEELEPPVASPFRLPLAVPEPAPDAVERA